MFGFIKEKIKRVLLWSVVGLLVPGSLLAATGWKVDSFGNITGGRSSVILDDGETRNCRLSISGSTLSVVGRDGNALSANNPCVVGVHDASGAVRAVRFTSPQSVTFGATSDTDGNLFGISEANWSELMPWFFGVATNGTDSYFIMGRRPRVATGTGATDICQKGDVDCDSADDQMLWATGLTLSGWTSKPVTPLGFFHVTYATTGNAWTPTISNNLSEGFTMGRAIGQRYHMPFGQNGANANYPWSGTTPPTWAVPASIEYDYWFESIFSMCLRGTTAGAGSATNGTGTGVFTLRLPLNSVMATGADTWWPIGTYTATGHTPVNGILTGHQNATSDQSIGFYDAGLTGVVANQFTGASDDLNWEFCYPLQ